MRAWMALLLALVLLASCSNAGSTAQTKSPGSSPPSAAASPQSSSLVETRQWKLGPVADIAVGPNAAYVLYSPATSEGALPNATDARLARIDRATGIVVTAGPFPFAWHIALAGSVVWIGPNDQYSGTSVPDSRTLVSVDAVTLGVQQRVILPMDGAQRQLIANVTSDSSSLWVAYGSHVYRLHASSGRTLASGSISGIATSIALDPAGRRLYVGVDVSDAAASAAISEFEPSTLKRLASAPTGGAGLGGPQVAAGADDVWVSYATGMLGQVEHRQSSNLALIPIAAVPFTNGVHVFALGGIVWVIDSMAGRLLCLDPLTGAVRAGWDTLQGGVVSGDRSAVYLGDINGVGVFQPDPRCS